MRVTRTAHREYGELFMNQHDWNALKRDLEQEDLEREATSERFREALRTGDFSAYRMEKLPELIMSMMRQADEQERARQLERAKEAYGHLSEVDLMAEIDKLCLEMVENVARFGHATFFFTSNGVYKQKGNEMITNVECGSPNAFSDSYGKWKADAVVCSECKVPHDTIQEMIDCPASVRHRAEARAAHIAEVNAISEHELYTQMEELAKREIEKPPCEECEELSYYDVMERLRANPELSLNDYIRLTHLRELTYASGYVRPCLKCDAQPVERRLWIRDIRIGDFRAFLREHEGAYCLDELRDLLPDGHPEKPVRNGLEFALDLSKAPGVEIKGIRNKGGFEFL